MRIGPGGMAAMQIGMTIDAARVDIGMLSLADLIRTAYRVKAHEVTGPDWMGNTRFNIQAKIPDGMSKDLVPEMLQQLLAERFKLTFHREKKEVAVYALVPGKNGPKLKEAAPAPGVAPENKVAGNDVKISPIGGGGGRGVAVSAGGRGAVRMQMGENGAMRFAAERMAMPAFCEMLSRFVDRPVVDNTGLAGEYQFGFDISMEEIGALARKAGAIAMQAGANPGTPARVAPESEGATTSIFTSIQSLGLKLEGRKSPVDIIVVDRLEKAPTEN